MAAPELNITLDKPDRTYAGGESITGQVEVTVVKDVQEAELVLFFHCLASSKAQGIARTLEKPQEDVLLFKGAWLPGQYSYRFQVVAPESPPTYHGQVFDVAWSMGAKANIARGEEMAAEADITLISSKRLPPPDEAAITRKAVPPEAQKSLMGCFFVALVFACLGVFLLWQAFSVGLETAGVYGWGGVVVTTLGSGALFLVIYSALVNRRIKRAEFILASRQVAQGEKIPFTLAFETNIPFEIDKVRVILRRNEIIDFFRSSRLKQYLKHKVYEDAQDVPLADKFIQRNVPYRINGEVWIPPDAPCSLELMESGKGMALRWEIEVAIVMKRYPDWFHFEDIIVQPASLLR